MKIRSIKKVIGWGNRQVELDKKNKFFKRKEKDEEKLYLASQWKLMWWTLKKHKLAMISMVILIIMYMGVLFPEFIAPYDPNERNAEASYAPPQKVQFKDDEGFSLRPFVYGYKSSVDLETLNRIYKIDKEQKYHLYLFARGDSYKLWNLFETNVHLFGTREGKVYFFGTNRLGQDVFSQVIYGSRISLTIGLAGVAISFLLGLTLGGISGYFGGIADEIIQRIIEIIKGFPSLPLWMALSAAVPVKWGPVQVYFAITVILSFIGWTGLARVVRGKLMALSNEDFVIAARLAGASESRIIAVHMIPSFMSHLIASLSMSIPGMILGETSLSFLGIGLRPPAVSWGVLLQSAQNLHTVSQAPWLLIPGLFVIITVLAFNFLGDGLRDAADPYSR